MQTAKLTRIDPEIWLADVLERDVSGDTTDDRLAELWPGIGRPTRASKT
ncbi:transposase domain-containing protein [Bradyrhizobium macuxiense]